MRWVAVILTIGIVGATWDGPGATGVVRGTVFDSVSHRFLAGAIVQLGGADSGNASLAYSARSDSAGRYAISGVVPGRYVAGFFHAAADSLGIEPATRIVAVREGRQDVAFALPSPRTLRARLCTLTDNRTGADGVLIGHLREAETEQPIVGGRIAADWFEVGRDAGSSVVPRNVEASGETAGPGWFVLCGVPSDLELLVRATRGGDSSGFVTVKIPRDSIRHVTLHVGSAARSARLIGRVRDEHGAPVTTAQATIIGSDRGAQSNASGEFVLDSLPAGTHTLEVKAIGFAPTRVPVQLAASLVAHADLVAIRVTTLAPVETREVLYSRHFAEFDHDRRSSAGGKFIEQVRLPGYPAVISACRLLRELTGTYVDARCVTESEGATCVEYFVNGMRKPQFSITDVDPDDILGLEVFMKLLETPFKYLPVGKRKCGVVVLWTR